MDFEKAYKAVLKTATQWIKDGCTDKEKICLESVFPQLAESEDERIRKFLVDYFASYKIGNVTTKLNGVRIDDILNYLEKQKENPKNAISIPADCASNAKCPYKIHGDEEFIGDIRDTPAYHFGFDDGVRSEMEKQKEQKDTSASTMVPSCWEVEQKEQKPVQSNAEKEYVRTLKSLISDFLRGKEDVDREYYQQIFDWLDGRQIEQKPAEWSEKDSIAIKVIQMALAQYCTSENQRRDLCRWLDLHCNAYPLPEKLYPHWKPSEEQMKALLNAEGFLRAGLQHDSAKTIAKLYEQLKSL